MANLYFRVLTNNTGKNNFIRADSVIKMSAPLIKQLFRGEKGERYKKHGSLFLQDIFHG